MKKLWLALPFLLSSSAFAQTVTFTTNGGPCCQNEAYTVVSEDGTSASGTVEIATPYGYSESGIVLPYNPTAPGEYLNPVINLVSTTYTGNWGDATRTVRFVFNSTENLYGYYWSGTFTSTLTCVHYYRARCSGYGPGKGYGSMTAAAIQ